jgi:hypothetical protein
MAWSFKNSGMRTSLSSSREEKEGEGEGEGEGEDEAVHFGTGTL